MKLLLRHTEKDHSHNSIPAENVQLESMEKQQTDPGQGRSIKLLSALSKDTSVIKDMELDSGSWEKYCRGKY